MNRFELVGGLGILKQHLRMGFTAKVSAVKVERSNMP
jgi:hypothetical protein